MAAITDNRYYFYFKDKLFGCDKIPYNIYTLFIRYYSYDSYHDKQYPKSIKF